MRVVNHGRYCRRLRYHQPARPQIMHIPWKTLDDAPSPSTSTRDFETSTNRCHDSHGIIQQPHTDTDGMANQAYPQARHPLSTAGITYGTIRFPPADRSPSCHAARGYFKERTKHGTRQQYSAPYRNSDRTRPHDQHGRASQRYPPSRASQHEPHDGTHRHEAN